MGVEILFILNLFLDKKIVTYSRRRVVVKMDSCAPE
jgi:hypothetical protein